MVKGAGWVGGWVGGESKDPHCESLDPGILCKGGGMGGRQVGSSVASCVLLMLVLANGEDVLQQSPGYPTEEWAACPVFRKYHPEPLCCDFFMGHPAETNSIEHH